MSERIPVDPELQSPMRLIERNGASVDVELESPMRLIK